MPNIAVVLRDEIARLARKEVRAEVAALKKTTASQRSQIAELKRQVDTLQKTVKRLAREGAARQPKGSAPAGEGAAARVRFRADGISGHRKRLGLSAADFGRLVGVTGQTVYNWEAGTARPREGQLPAIAAVRKMGRREALARLAEAA